MGSGRDDGRAAKLGTLVRRAGTQRELIASTDHGQVAAVLVNPQDLAELEEAVALAEYRVAQVSGTSGHVAHHDVRHE